MEADTAFLAAIANKIKGKAFLGGDDDTKSVAGSTIKPKSPRKVVREPAPTHLSKTTTQQDEVMLDVQDGPPLLGTAAQLNEARQALNTKTPKLRHARSTSSIKVPGSSSPASRRYHPQMGMGTGKPGPLFTLPNSPFGQTISESKPTLITSSFAPQIVVSPAPAFIAEGVPIRSPIQDASNSKSSSSATEVGAVSGLNMRSANLGTALRDTVKKSEDTPPNPNKRNITAAGIVDPVIVRSSAIATKFAQPDAIMTGTTPHERGTGQLPKTFGITSLTSDVNDDIKKQGDTSPTTTFEDFVTQYQNTINAMKSEMFQMQRHLEIIIQTDEKRKFLGTDQAKTPYEISVVCGQNKNKLQVQVDATKTVADLIRRVRCTFKIKPQDSSNPRIIFKGIKVGHGMTLSEVGIVSGTEVEFAYSDVGGDEEL